MSQSLGQIFTPLPIAVSMLDDVGFKEHTLLQAKIMEPSFGRGVFLLEIVERIISYARSGGATDLEVVALLERNVHGIEFDEILYKETIDELDDLVFEFGLPKVKWNLHNGDTFDFVEKYRGSMDIVVGNPPYIRIHKMPAVQRAKVKGFSLAVGTTDLYVVFFEIGLAMLRESGKLAFITPNAFLKNESQATFRNRLLEDRLLTHLADYRMEKVFGKTNVYVAITHLDKANGSSDFTFQIGGDSQSKKSVLFAEVPLSTPWRFDDVNGILESQNSLSHSVSELVDMQYSVMSMRNAIYIDGNPVVQKDGTYLFNGSFVEDGILKPAVKANTYKGGLISGRMIFPYSKVDGKNIPMSEEYLQAYFPLAHAYLESHKDELALRNMEKSATEWFQFGRSQGLQTVGRKKVVYNGIVNPQKLAQGFLLDEDVVVYTGFCAIPLGDGEATKFCEVIGSPEFIEYVKVVAKDKSGGYLEMTPKLTKSFRF